MNSFKIGNIKVGENCPPLVIVELGINHKEYTHLTKLTENNIKSLSADFI